MTEDDTNQHLWRAPTGAVIEGTLEQIPGTAYVTFDSSGAWDHVGGTDVFWNGQETVRRAGEIVWCDEDGEDWLESELVKDPEAALPETIASPWDDAGKLRLLLEEHLKAFYEVALADRKQVQTSPSDFVLGVCSDAILTEVSHLRNAGKEVS